jgi:hypothetical protein
MKKTTIRQLERCLVHDLGKQIMVTVTNRGSRLEEGGDTKPEAGSSGSLLSLSVYWYAYGIRRFDLADVGD